VKRKMVLQRMRLWRAAKEGEADKTEEPSQYQRKRGVPNHGHQGVGNKITEDRLAYVHDSSFRKKHLGSVK